MKNKRILYTIFVVSLTVFTLSTILQLRIDPTELNNMLINKENSSEYKTKYRTYEYYGNNEDIKQEIRYRKSLKKKRKE